MVYHLKRQVLESKALKNNIGGIHHMANNKYQELITSVEEGMKILADVPEVGEELAKSEDESVEEVTEVVEEVAESEDVKEDEVVEEADIVEEEVSKSEDTDEVAEVADEVEVEVGADEEVMKSEDLVAESGTTLTHEATVDGGKLGNIGQAELVADEVIKLEGGEHLEVLTTMATAITDLTSLFTNMKADITALKDSQEVISKSLEEAKVEREELSKSLVEPEGKSAVMPVQREVLTKSEEVLNDEVVDEPVVEDTVTDTFGKDVEDFFFGRGHALSPRDVEVLRPIVISAHHGDATEGQRKEAGLIMDKYNK